MGINYHRPRDQYVDEMFDGKVRIVVTIPPKLHEKVLEELKRRQMNRMEWMREAITEKVVRDTRRK